MSLLIEGHACNFYKDHLEVWEKTRKENERHFLNELGTDEDEQMNNSTEGILLFKSSGHSMYDSFLGAKGFPYINLCTPPKALGRLQSRRGDQSTLLFLPHLSWHRILALLALQNAI